MSTASYFGKMLLKATGRRCTHQAAKATTKTLQTIVKGQSKGAKRKFYKALSLFIKNPENKAAEQVIRESVENSSQVARQLDNECAEAVAKARKMAEEAHPLTSNPTENELIMDIRKSYEITAREGFSYTYGARKKLASLPIEQEIISPVRLHHGLQNARKEAMEGLRNLDIPMPSVNLTQAEVDRIVKETIRETISESATLTSRRITYPVNKFASFFLPKNIKALCKDIMHLPKEQFGKEFYARLVKSKGLTDRAPAEITILDKEGIKLPSLFSKNGKANCVGGFSPQLNSISFSKEFSKLSRSAQANLISHELRHFEQSDAIIRTFGIEKYIDALKSSCLKKAKGHLLNIGTPEKELIAQIDEQFKTLEPQIKQAFAKSIQAEKIHPNSTAGKQAGKYLTAMSNYESFDPGNPFTIFKYLSNGLEKEAYKTGYITKFLTSFLERLNLTAA